MGTKSVKVASLSTLSSRKCTVPYIAAYYTAPTVGIRVVLFVTL